MSRILSQALNFTRAFVGQFTQNTPHFQTHFAKGPYGEYVSPFVSNNFFLNIVRGSQHYFKPREGIRVKRLGYYAKVKTRKGRKQIMRRILKGRYVITH